MPWDDQIESGFPVPDPDEPESLRQDILDELRDHIECAMNRELLKDGDSNKAQQRVLVRFGDPLKIVRRLWVEAMQEKLMSKRLNVITVAILSIACVVACGMTWSMAQQLQRATENAQQASIKLLQQGEYTNRELAKQNQAIMQRLAAIAEKDGKPTASLDWNPFRVQVVKDDSSKSPAQGFIVGFRGNAHTASEEVVLSEKSDAQGMVDFGVVRPGTYSVAVTTPWGETHSTSTLVRPGTEHTISVTCPAQDTKKVAIDFEVKWPDSIPDDPDLVFTCEVARTDSRQVDGEDWFPSNSVHVAVKRTGEMATYKSILETGERTKFYGEPTPVSSLEMNGSSFRVTRMNVVRLNDGAWPANENVIDRLAPSSLFKRYQAAHFRIPQEFTQKFDFDMKDATDDKCVVSIPKLLLDATLASIKAEERSKIPKTQIFSASVLFFRSDKDNDLALSETECNDSSSIHRIKFSEFPVTFDRFVTVYAESQNFGSRSRGGTSGRDR
jgi:hypothetical protein